jgi:hypothetical protein
LIINVPHRKEYLCSEDGEPFATFSTREEAEAAIDAEKKAANLPH